MIPKKLLDKAKTVNIAFLQDDDIRNCTRATSTTCLLRRQKRKLYGSKALYPSVCAMYIRELQRATQRLSTT